MNRVGGWWQTPTIKHDGERHHQRNITSFAALNLALKNLEEFLSSDVLSMAARLLDDTSDSIFVAAWNI